MWGRCRDIDGQTLLGLQAVVQGWCAKSLFKPFLHATRVFACELQAEAHDCNVVFGFELFLWQARFQSQLILRGLQHPRQWDMFRKNMPREVHLLIDDAHETASINVKDSSPGFTRVSTLKII